LGEGEGVLGREFARKDPGSVYKMTGKSCREKYQTTLRRNFTGWEERSWRERPRISSPQGVWRPGCPSVKYR